MSRRHLPEALATVFGGVGDCADLGHLLLVGRLLVIEIWGFRREACYA